MFFEMKERLPYLVIDLFKKSNGVVIKVGDRTHPTGVEVIAEYMDWAERNERLAEQLIDVLKQALAPKSGLPPLNDARYIT